MGEEGRGINLVVAVRPCHPPNKVFSVFGFFGSSSVWPAASVESSPPPLFPLSHLRTGTKLRPSFFDRI